MKFTKKLSVFFIMVFLVSSIIIPTYANSYSITIKNNNTAISINDNVYNAYLLFEVVDNEQGGYVFNPDTCIEVSYTVAGGTVLTGDDLIQWLSDPIRTNEELYDFSIKTYKDYIDADPATPPSASATAVNQEAVIPLTNAGYYLVSGGGERVDNHSPITTLVSLSAANPTSLINPKFDVPTLDKNVYHDDEEAYAKYADHGIGDTVLYQIKTTIPITTGYTQYQYIISDTLDDGLTFNNDVILKAEVSSATITIDESYCTLDVDPSSSKTFSLKIDILSLIKDEVVSVGDILITEFSAVLNENALINPDGINDNEAFLNYSNNPQNLSSIGRTPLSRTESSTFKIDLIKTDNESNPIDGAKFVMTLEDTLIKDDQGIPTNVLNFIESATATYTLAPSDYEGSTVYTLTAGTISLLGLNDNVDYFLHEINAPDGYVANKEPTSFSIIAKYDELTGDLLVDYPKIVVNESTTEVQPTLEISNDKETNLPDTGETSSSDLLVLGSILLLLGGIVYIIEKNNFKRC